MRAKTAAALTVMGVLGLASPAAGAPTKTCVEEGKNKNFTNVSTQTSACNSSSDQGRTGPNEVKDTPSDKN